MRRPKILIPAGIAALVLLAILAYVGYAFSQYSDAAVMPVGGTSLASEPPQSRSEGRRPREQADRATASQGSKAMPARGEAALAPPAPLAPQSGPSPQQAPAGLPRPGSWGSSQDTTLATNTRSPIQDTRDEDTSNFGLDADTTSYHLALARLRQGLTVRPESVRAEEWTNAFTYHYDPPREDTQFSIRSHLSRHPLAREHDAPGHLVRIAIQAPGAHPEVDRPMNVTLVLDASGSMQQGNRVEIARQAAHAITGSLDRDDLVSIVHFSETVLHQYTVRHKYPPNPDIPHSIRSLHPTASTNVQAGLDRGVILASQARKFRPDALNYIILMSDGVANVDATNPFVILDTVGDHNRENPIRLITVGVGISNYNDYLLEQLAQHGDGWYRYLDSPQQAQDTFGRGWETLAIPFADQTRAQVTWNPDLVRAWRLVGYENRIAPHQDFQEDLRKFAEIPRGGAVTVFYELELHQEPDLLQDSRNPQAHPLGRIQLRWVDPDSGQSQSQAHEITLDRSPQPLEYQDPMFGLGAIVTLAADRYAALAHPGLDRRARPRAEIATLLTIITSTWPTMGNQKEAHRDLTFLLRHISKAAESHDPYNSGGPSGYTP